MPSNRGSTVEPRAAAVPAFAAGEPVETKPTPLSPEPMGKAEASPVGEAEG